MFMGKSIPSSQKLQQIARFVASPDNGSNRRAQLKPASKARPISPSNPTGPRTGSNHQLKVDNRHMEAAENSDRQRMTPLADVVADCVKRWFQDTLKEAKNGDTSMQVLVGQMYYSGYGVGRDSQKAKAWINRASRTRSSVWKVGDKHPGYNASDSDSDDPKEEAK
ncbi:hypothetical protein ABFS82_06G060800 [Erythranthe guttata]|uniref:Uncharacterized protein n=1 Tax=Erythranthe guttata TaxID=4155 RepID=A0A022PX41_ERYGU|nr:PREDICTED: uncharacterized protein LOC105977942 [Erythranthe guttata]XP_012858797.1 PREDICTED: uncharacterized protein LOC105977942 [Erythranthe guttata]EYU20083.1 hypothetical protein MIMGU_mgv1a015205mg [Erythranthe guttata]EYU20084.1 hypothetical protein MIMGU_mgv1a015205mg [Erythranthe guttata]EYU20085.1 hypothetical protein MIMGU_mgv1a015205mg [Erythranthe guttata]|eukprot:XP_012858796.1 PREDICTED: uncharacterized protein LOC105977942 [Erythranthe guttata]